jgi:hypothetical protein
MLRNQNNSLESKLENLMSRKLAAKMSANVYENLEIF